MTRDSAEFSAALLLGALGGAAVALALQSSDLNPRRRRARRRSLASLGSAFAGALQEQVKELQEQAKEMSVTTEPMDRLRKAARGLGRLRELGAGFGR